MPNLYIIAGHNGAGKSTFGKSLLPQNAQNLTIFPNLL
jgi:predicted ABC-type ATPase